MRISDWIMKYGYVLWKVHGNYEVQLTMYSSLEEEGVAGADFTDLPGYVRMFWMFQRRRCHFHEGNHLIVAQIWRATLDPYQVPFLRLLAEVEVSYIGLVNLYAWMTHDSSVDKLFMTSFLRIYTQKGASSFPPFSSSRGCKKTPGNLASISQGNKIHKTIYERNLPDNDLYI